MVAISGLLFTTFVLLVLLMYVRMLYNYIRKVRIVESTTSGNEVIVRKYKQAPGPVPWPVIGNLALLGRFKVPFQGFTELSKEFGDIYTLSLGSTRCLVVNNLDLIREVLNQNGKFFGGRPDFLRYHKLFGGDRNNSLALCDWSSLQQKRRNLARRHCSPRNASSYFTKMSNVGCLEASELIDRLKEKTRPGMEFEVKPLIQQTCANMFSQYMCSVSFDYDDIDFQNIVEYFDEIFWEINQGYALDFLPWLAPFYKRHTNTIMGWSTTIRKFILERIINEREQNVDVEEPETDFTDALLKSLMEDKNVSRDTIIFMLEDFIGGHSAVGNLVMMALAHIAFDSNVGKQIQMEADAISNHGQRNINLYDMDRMPYTMATIFEVLRYSSSPIVPHVATEDTVISGHGVTEGTIVFINNYKMNTSTEYWQSPELFQPERFLEIVDTTETLNTSTNKLESSNGDSKRRNSEGSDSGIEYEKDSGAVLSSSMSENSFLNPLTKLKKQIKSQQCASEAVQVKKNLPHFLPFSIGKRTCIGQNLVRGFGFILLANILQHFDVSSNDLSSIKTTPACVALPAKTFPLVFKPRSLSSVRN